MKTPAREEMIEDEEEKKNRATGLQINVKQIKWFYECFRSLFNILKKLKRLLNKS